MALNMDDLRAFALVVEEANVTRAAQRLGVTQQAVSERIMRLERRLSVKLFKRRAHGMEPTPAAYRFLPYAQRVAALIDRALVVIQDDRLLRVSVHAPSAAVAVPFVERVLVDLDLQIAEKPDAESVLASVADGSADLGVGSFSAASLPSHDMAESSDRPPLAEVVVEVIHADPLVCVTSPDHPLARRAVVTVADIEQAGVALAAALVRGDSGDEVRVCGRSLVAGPLATGSLVELAVEGLPSWVVPISIAYRSTDSGYGPVQLLRDAAIGSVGASRAVAV